MYEIRDITENDAKEITRLLTLLGHQTTVDEINNRWDIWRSEGNVGFVIEYGNGTLAGIVTLHRMFVLHRAHFVGRITALVVDERFRGQSIEEALIATAEEYFKKSGCELLEITNHKRWKEAHLFYGRLDYERTSELFGKILVKSDA